MKGTEMERPAWADARPWEKYPADVLADLEIKGPGENVKLVGVNPAAAHAELLRAYLAAQARVTGDTEPDFFFECIDQAARGGGFAGMSGHGCSATLYYRRPSVDTGETHRCPRRDESPGSDERFPGPDRWTKTGEWRDCSYCGSMHPEDVIEAVKRLGPSIIGSCDKSYKRYIRLPDTPNASFGPIKFYVMHFDQLQIDTVNSLLKGEKKA